MALVDVDRCTQIAIAANSQAQATKKCYAHWSFVWQNRRLLGHGENIPRQEYVMKRFGYTRPCGGIHSEVSAMRKVYGLLDRRKPWQIVNISLNASNELRMSCPCRICQSFLNACGCSKVWFSTNNDTYASYNI